MQPRNLVFLAVLIAMVIYLGSSCTSNVDQLPKPAPSGSPIQPTPPAPAIVPVPIGAIGTQPEQEVDLGSQPSEQAPVIQPESQEAGGTSLTLDSPLRTDDPLTFSLALGTPFEGQVIFGNDTGAELGFLLLCLLDYVQTPCIRGQGEAVFRFELKTGEREVMEVYLPELAEGLHDLLVVVFLMPDAHLTDPQFQENSRFLYHFHRVNVLVGDVHRKPEIKYRSFDEPDEFAARGINVLALTQAKPRDPWDAPWHFADLSPGESVTFHLWWNNTQASPATFAAVAFLGYQQVPISGDLPILYGELAGHRRADIVGNVTVPADPGPHEFVILVIENPYTVLSQSTLVDQPLPLFVYSTDRVLITVQ
jgi:hypothetical protein